MCRAHQAHSRHHGSHSESHFEDAGLHWGWREFFMRGGPRGWGGPHHQAEDDGGNFGVRRPLRFLAHKLELDEKQVAELAKILDELKTERAQAAVDDRRSLADFAEALGGETFDTARATTAGDRRVASTTRAREAVTKALSQMHALLSPEQRGRLAYMVRTGVLGL